MTQVVFTGSSGTIPNLNQNFTQTYDLREFISTPAYVAATPRMTFDGLGNVAVGGAPLAGEAKNLIADVLAVRGALAAHQTSVGVLQFSVASHTLMFRPYGLTAGTGRISFSSGGGGGTIDTERVVLDATGNLLNVSTGGLGYGTGSGGAVTQITSKSTGVTLNKSNGGITLTAASLAATTSVSFVLTNSLIAATDVVNVSIRSGATLASYLVQVDAVAAGSCTITLRNYTAGALAEALVLNFAVIKAVTA